jgi:hypothetical protein
VLAVSLALFAFLFETPLAALLVAAGAASIPVIIHLLNRNRYRIVTWAAMRFLLAAQRKNTRRLRLEQMVLLAVRTLIVLLLVLAMMSVMPWTEALWQRLFPGRASLAVVGGRRTHKILVLDGSFSMALRAGEGTCFDRARALASRLVLESPGGDGFSVVLMSAPPRRIVAEPSDDARKVAEEVQALHLPHGNADLVATFNAVEDMLGKSPEKFQEREVYFLTDLQRSSWTARQATDPTVVLQKIQAKARTVFLDVGQDGAANLAVTQLTLGQALVTTGAETPVTATIHNYGSEPVQQKRVELWVGKARGSSNDPPFAPRLVHQEVVDVAPGQSTPVSFRYKFATPGDFAVQVRLENDALELDDTRTLIVSVKDTVPVMLVNGKPAAALYDRATEWLKDALNPFQAEQTPRHIPARPKVLTESQFADVGLGDLTPYDCVFLCDVARLSAAEVRRLETHLQRGGGVVFCLGPQVDLEAYNRLLYRDGEKGILPAKLIGTRVAPTDRPYSFFAEEESYRLPPLDAFAGENDRPSLATARFRQYVRVEVPPRSGARTILSFVPAPLVNPTARNDSLEAKLVQPPGEPALIAWQRYRGQVILFTSTVNMDWTTWPISPSFPAFMQELLRLAVSGRLRGQATLVGDSLEEVLPVGSAGLEVVVHTPDGRPEETRTQDREENAVLRWTDTDVSGIYRATIGRHPQDYLFAVNVPTATESQQATESDLTRTNRDELLSAYPGWDFQIVTDPADVSHSGGPMTVPAGTDWPVRGLGTGLARNLLLIMLALMVAEVVLAWRFGHHAAARNINENPPASGWLVPGLIAGCVGLAFALLAGVLVHAAWTGDFLGFLPDHWRRVLEEQFEIPPPTPGEGTCWRLEYTPYLRDAGTDPWLAGAFALAIAGVVVVIYLNEGRTASSRYQLLLAGLRIGLVLLTLAVLLPQLRLLFERQSWPDIAIIIDDSRSMSHADLYQDLHVRQAAERLAKLGSLSAPERLQIAQALVTRTQPDWLETLLTRYQVKVHVYHCSGKAARIADVTDETDAHQHAEAIQAIRNLRAEGDSSQLGGAVRQVLNDFRGSSLAAVVMLTDGVTTEGEDLVKASRYAAQVGVPLFFVGIGDAHEVRDLKLHDLQVEDSVYVNDTIVFEVRLTGQGYTNLTVPVTLWEKGADRPLDTQVVRVDPQGKPVKVRLKAKPTEAGEKVYVIQVPEQPDEVKPADNNRLERTIYVRETKRIKVLYVEGYARYEYRFIKALLERESAQDPRNKTLDLKVLLLDADFEYPKLDKSALAEFPSKVELSQFDVLIFGDVDPADPKLNKHLPNVADFVRERGGGFLMIAGTYYSPHAFKDSPLRDILPIEVVGPEREESDYTVPFQPRLTGTGRFHPMFRFSPDEADNTAIWEHLAPIYWWSECYRAKPGAEVLAVHPHRDALTADRPSAGEAKHPLMVQQFVGAGRSMFFGVDETWRWRYREDELRFNQFWIQTVRHLSRTRLGRVELRLDRQTPYRRGEPMKITVRFPDDAPAPSPETEVKVLVERSLSRPDTPPEIEGQTLALTRVEGSRGTYEGLLTRTPEGEYRFWLSSPAISGPRPHAEGQVLPPPGEMDRLRMNQQDMERAAEETRGRFYTLPDADNLFHDLPSGSRVALSTSQPPWLLWNHSAMFLFTLLVLTAEWVLRKRKHLV